MDTILQDINQKIVGECIDYLVVASDALISRSDVIRMVANIVECTGGELDACSNCGAMPLTVNCNNAGCDR